MRTGRAGAGRRYLFYADEVMMALSDTVWMMGAVSTLVGLFYQVGLRKNFEKTVGMVYQLCQAAGTRIEERQILFRLGG